MPSIQPSHWQSSVAFRLSHRFRAIHTSKRLPHPEGGRPWWELSDYRQGILVALAAVSDLEVARLLRLIGVRSL